MEFHYHSTFFQFHLSLRLPRREQLTPVVPVYLVGSFLFLIFFPYNRLAPHPGLVRERSARCIHALKKASETACVLCCASPLVCNMSAFATSSQVANLAAQKSWVRGGQLGRVSARRNAAKPAKCVTVASIRQQGATQTGKRPLGPRDLKTSKLAPRDDLPVSSTSRPRLGSVDSVAPSDALFFFSLFSSERSTFFFSLRLAQSEDT